MKIKTKSMDYDAVMALPSAKKCKPLKTSMFFRVLLYLLCCWELMSTKFRLTKIGMEKLGKKEPCLYLMNHSAFMDMKIVCCMLFPKPFNIVTSNDVFVGMNPLIRLIGCIPAKKFIPDTKLVKDMVYCIRKLKSNVLMFPEAGYTLDGTATTLPDSLGKFLKLLKAPVVMVRTHGVFDRDPLFNRTKMRKAKTCAEMEYLLSPEDIERYSVEELNDIIAKQFSFDNFKYQQENEIVIDDPLRAEGLNRVLYKCPHCDYEGKMLGSGTTLKCLNCGKEYELTEIGYLKALDGDTRFDHVPDWYSWERECVIKELDDGTYETDVEVDIAIVKDTKYLYKVGEGRLVHNSDGFHLTGCEQRLDYHQKPLASYSVNADYGWYEIGDLLTIGTTELFYHCFPKNCGDVVTKMRLAAEELYKRNKDV